MTETLIKEKTGKSPAKQPGKLKRGYRRMQDFRMRNQERYHASNAVIGGLFPVFIVCMAELNQCVHISTFMRFFIHRPTVMLFDFLFAYLIYGLLVMLTNRIWAAAAVQGISYMTLSVVELFKYSTNGNHFKLVDLTVGTGFKSLKNLSSFAYIKITVPLVVYVLTAIAVLVFIFLRNPAFSKPLRERVLPALGFLTAGFLIICVPGVSHRIYNVFGVDTTASANAFSTNEKFERNGMLGFLVETTSERLGNLLEEPENYTQEHTLAAVTEKAKDAKSDVKPNVIVIMSESLADFRRVESLHLQTDAYDVYDRVAKRCHMLNVAVPTFASYTVRTEFELMFGLPVRSLQDTITPQREINVKEPSNMVSYYNSLGYETAYVHPFVETFYGRDTIYSTYGWDQMIFRDQFTVPVQEYGNGYVSDETVTDQIMALVKENDAPLYVHATTMQNHQPYDWIPDKTELEVYLEGVRTSSIALERLVNELEEAGEPTVLLFIGDHFPSMRKEGNIYDAAGINSENCDILYEQPALIWSNFELQEEALPQDTVSAFYLTPTMIEAAGLPVDPFYATVLKQRETNPVYTSIFMEPDDRNETLDLLTYDRVVGEDYTGSRPKTEE
ncbi:MAG: LTA synthase family protein [Oscillospiraceae bacterium]|nr:LTA synthase family protein [Oscillospiraceae bacterium]